jgi:hypothetical protein
MNSEREAQREYYVLREMVAELETDIVKFAGGNNTAGYTTQRIKIHSKKKGATKVTPFFLYISNIST